MANLEDKDLEIAADDDDKTTKNFNNATADNNNSLSLKDDHMNKDEQDATPNTFADLDSDEFQIKSNEALQFLFRDRRSFLHPGKTKCEEQKREARKAYEEKCSILGKRFCPRLSTWRDFQQWEIGGGYESKRNPLPTQPPTPRIQTMRTYHTRLYTPATLPTYHTPLYTPARLRK
ncbi:unnamed protein product [Rotaria sp. Silwood1]|nr:unnamed protein product [Rotaria sp. Silwood1]CAF1167011.1 unnamed protein product [Rotaria sp. Silwood1]CAF4831093.1 unnamed protein product [Rotaria sp. Silwood1]